MAADVPSPIEPLTAMERWVIDLIRTRLRYGEVTVSVRDGKIVGIKRVLETEKPPDER